MEKSQCRNSYVTASLVFLSALLVLLIFSEATGIFNGLDSFIFSYFPKNSSFLIELLSFSGGSTAFLIYAFCFITYDIMRVRRLTTGSVGFINALIVTLILVFTLKITFQVPRPGEGTLHYSIIRAIWNFDYYAFPSGHSARSAVLAYYVGRERSFSVKILIWLWATGVALSRISLSEHWFSDVLTAMVLGVLISLAIDVSAKWWVPLYNKLVSKVKVLRVELPN